MPWYISIAISALCLRLCILPFSFLQLQLVARVQSLRPIWQHIATMYLGSTNRYRGSIVRVIPKLEGLYICSTILLHYIRMYNIKVRRFCYPIFISIPLCVTFNAACRQLMYGESSSTIVETLSTEGPFWCPDLTQPDATLYLPLLAFVTTIINLHYIFIKYQVRTGSSDGGGTVSTPVQLQPSQALAWKLRTMQLLADLRTSLIPQFVQNIGTGTHVSKGNGTASTTTPRALPR
uniref:Mitochondrial inner membrane protein COX18 n=1 Tax=Lygus hesperus TaxID=30085 RepID=A0A0A9WJ52_LYGHE